MMRKLITLVLAMALIVSFGLVGCGGNKQGTDAKPAAKQESLEDLLAKGRNLPGLSYDFAISTKDGQVMNGKMWVTGKKMRTETVVHNEKIITITDAADNVTYTYMPGQNMAMKIALDPAIAAKSADQYSKEVDAAKATVLETTTYEGVRCKVLQMQDTAGNPQTKMWVREDYGLPVKVEITALDGQKTVIEYKNLKVGAVSADNFQLPAGVPVTDMSGLINKLPQKP